MQTYKSIMESTGLKYSTLRFRARKLELPKRYQDDELGKSQRVFTPDEVNKLLGGDAWRTMVRKDDLNENSDN